MISTASPFMSAAQRPATSSVITRSQYDAVLQEVGDEDKAAAETAANRTIARTAVERIAALRTTGGISEIKDPFNAVFDGVLRQGPLHTPAPREPVLAGRLLDQGDGTGATAVLRAATAPAQATAPLAHNSADLSGSIFTEIGEDPAAWRKLIPKGSDVSNGLTELAASRIDAVSYPQGSSHLIQPTVHNQDGTYTAGVRLGATPGQPDERLRFLDFVARGGDIHHLDTDPDMARIRAAADDYSIRSLSDAIRHGPRDGAGPHGFATALSKASDLDGVITRSHYDALVEQSTDMNEAATHTAADRATALTAIERIAAAQAFGGISSPTNALIKDPFNAAFDGMLRQGPLKAPVNETPLLAENLLDADNAEYLNHRSYLIVSSMHDAGAVPVDAERFFVDGRLLPLDKIANLPGDTLNDLRRAAEVGPPALQSTWLGSVPAADGARAGYGAAGTTPEPDPTTDIDGNATRSRIRYGG